MGDGDLVEPIGGPPAVGASLPREKMDLEAKLACPDDERHLQIAGADYDDSLHGIREKGS